MVKVRLNDGEWLYVDGDRFVANSTYLSVYKGKNTVASFASGQWTAALHDWAQAKSDGAKFDEATMDKSRFGA